MSNIKRHKLAFVAIILIFSISACNLIPVPVTVANQSQTDLNTAQDIETERNENLSEAPNILTESPSPIATEEESSTALETINLDNLEEYQYPLHADTYQTTIEHSFSTSENNFTRISLKADVNILEQKSKINEEQESTIENWPSEHKQDLLIDGVVASKLGESCSVVNFELDQTEKLPVTFLFRRRMPNRFLKGEVKLAEENLMINDRITNRYALDETNFDPESDYPLIIDSVDQGDLYLDAETGSLAKVVIEGSGQDRILNDTDPKLMGNIRYELNHLNFNQPVEIEFLPDCGLLPQTQFPAIEPILTYSNNSADDYIEIITLRSMQETADFYRAELQATDWTLLDEVSFGEESTILEFQNSSGERLDVDLMEVALPDGDSNTIITIYLLP
jgi:hypothetical protein